MEIILLPEADKDLEYWKKSGDKKVLKRIAQLIDSISNSPFEGIGKPEPLKYELSGCWSRRINKEHRLIYEVYDDNILIHSLRGHYK
jgi:toxin YoeB